MINLAKQWVLRSLDRAGYRLLKKPDHEALLVAAAAPHNTPTPTEAPIAPASAPVRHRFDRGARKLRRHAGGFPDRRGEPIHAGAAPCARALSNRTVPGPCRNSGEVVDCGYGATATLAAQCCDTGRQLVLFDSSADPLHRGETELELWGTARDLIAGTPAWSRSRQVEPLPDALTETGYPADRIAVRRYPR